MKILTARVRSYSSLAAAVLTVSSSVGCDQASHHFPAAPSVVATPAVPAAPAAPPLAVLQFATLKTHLVTDEDGRSSYVLKLVLAETGGRSGAHFSTPTVRGDSGCATSNSIEPGGTWDMDVLSYCAPGPFAFPRVTATVYFTDDEGRAGILTGESSLEGAASVRR